MNRTLIQYTLIIICVIPLGSCSRYTQRYIRKIYITHDSCARKISHPPQESWLTIWVHGARPFGNDTDLYGLCKPCVFQKSQELGRIASILIKIDSVMFDPENFYVFSWSGKLDFDERARAGRVLYEHLEQERKHYYLRYGRYPKIRLLCHSHGGNVVLSMACVKNTEFVIDELFASYPQVVCQLYS